MNAIILAAGLGARLLPLTLERPKPLIEINGLPIIEKQIVYLQEIGIKEIFVVVGYKADCFDYLIQKFGIYLIYNPRFSEYNNLYSLYLARNILGDSYIVDGDVYFFRNFLINHLSSSTYFSRYDQKLEGEWILEFTNKALKRIIVDHSKMDINHAYIISGVSYWAEKDALIIKDYFKKLIDDNGDFYDSNNKCLFWDQIILENLHRLSIEVITLSQTDTYEIDDEENLDEIKIKSRNVNEIYN